MGPQTAGYGGVTCWADTRCPPVGGSGDSMVESRAQALGRERCDCGPSSQAQGHREGVVPSPLPWPFVLRLAGGIKGGASSHCSHLPWFPPLYYLIHDISILILKADLN